MKNISRRVFIKGLAVAGVAAAASTVLAGCNTNMIPGVEDPTEDPTEEPSTDSKTLTWTDPKDAKKTLSITLSSMTVSTLGASDAAIISAKIVDDLKSSTAKIQVIEADTYTDNQYATGDYAVLVSAYVNGEKGKEGTVEVGPTTYKDNLVFAGSTAPNTVVGSATSTVTKNGNIVVSGLERDKWNKVSVKLELYHVAKAGSPDDKTLLATKTIDFSK